MDMQISKRGLKLSSKALPQHSDETVDANAALTSDLPRYGAKSLADDASRHGTRRIELVRAGRGVLVSWHNCLVRSTCVLRRRDGDRGVFQGGSHLAVPAIPMINHDCRRTPKHRSWRGTDRRVPRPAKMRGGRGPINAAAKSPQRSQPIRIPFTISKRRQLSMQLPKQSHEIAS